MGHLGRAAKLATLALTGQGVAYLLSIVLARRLEVEGFEAYVVASAAFTMMIMFAPRGIDKYALRLLPTLFERGDWGYARGFLRFGLREIFWTSVIVATAVGLSVLYFSEAPRATKFAIGVSCLSLPTGALVHYGVEVLSANGRHILGTAIFRAAVPITTFVFVGLLLVLPLELSGAMAVACWGAAWTLALAVMAVEARRTTPPEVCARTPPRNLEPGAQQRDPFGYTGSRLPWWLKPA